MLSIQPIGGVGQIGSNMTLFKDQTSSFLIDCGILFPNEDFFDINYLIPDLDSLDASPSDIVISHGHEDHIGAIIHLIEKFPQINIHAPQFARELILKKLEYSKISHQIKLFTEDSVIKIGHFKIDPIHVNHSIPDTYGLLINSSHPDYKDTSLFYVSDFKIDLRTPYEKAFNFTKLIEKSSHANHKILFADSTNITSSKLNTPSEIDVFKGLSHIIDKKHKRIFVTTFSSNVHRIQSLINIASNMNYSVIPYGRSMKNYINIALRTFHLEDNNNCLRDSKSISNDDKNLIVLLSGCQGDFRGSLKRVASGTDPIFTPKKGDHFIFSSKPIPGNEKKIYNIVNDLSVMGVDTTYDNKDTIHSSGHPGRNDLLELYEQFAPNHIIPIHGEQLFLKKHYEFIDENFKKARPYLLTNHDIITISSTGKVKVKKSKQPPLPKLIHGNGIELERKAVSERRKLACTGAVFVSIKIESLTKHKLIFSYNFVGLPDFINQSITDFENLIISEVSNRKIEPLEKTAEELRIFIRRFLNNILGYKPTTLVHFI